MILGVGIDLVETDRISRIWHRFGQRFSRRILTAEEAVVLPARPDEYLASRFAAKEAAVKALGTGFSGGITFQCLSVRSLGSGQPELELRSKALEKAQDLGVTKIYLSLTHTRSAAAAVVILEN